MRKAYLLIFLLTLHKTSDKYFSVIILGHSKCIILRPIILILHQKALKCTYEPNTIKLNAFVLLYKPDYKSHFYDNKKTTTCIYSYCLFGCTHNHLKVLHNRGGSTRGRDGVMDRCGARWERRGA